MIKKLIRFYDLFKSFFIRDSHSFNLDNILVFKEKKDIKFDSFNHIWIVNDYCDYSYYREKIIDKKKFYVGIGHTTNFLETLNVNILKILTISADSHLLIDFDKYKSHLYDVFDVILFVPNFGRDLGSHKYALIYLNKFNINKNSVVILSNSSFIPNLKICSFNFWNCLSAFNNAILGSSYCFGPKYYLRKPRHLQSFYLVLSYNYFSTLFSRINFLNNTKDHVIRCGEVKLVELAINSGVELFICYDGLSFYIWGPGEYSYGSYDHRLNF